MKVRIAFITFLIISILGLFYYNQSQAGLETDYTKKVALIVIIFIITFIVMLYVVSEFYRVMHSEMKEQVEMLTASQNDLQTTYDSVSMLMIEINHDYKIANINDAGCKYFDKKKNQIIGKKLDEILGFKEEATITIKNAVDNTFKLHSHEKTEIESSSNIFEVFTCPFQDTGEKLQKVLLVLNDVTHTRAMYRQMMQDNKMVAIGQLAAGVAHEIRNPLGLIRNYCHLLKKSPTDDEEIRNKAISMIEKAVDRSGGIIDNLLQFSRASNAKWVEVNLNNSLNSIISLEENLLLKNNVKVKVNCSEDIKINVIFESLEIILINLILNALEAMDGGGEININCFENGEKITIKVSDTGEGIPEEIKGSIFNPFYTTKENRNGCGLGLYIVYNEITKLGGTIKVDSIKGEGATFTIELPVKRGDEINE